MEKLIFFLFVDFFSCYVKSEKGVEWRGIQKGFRTGRERFGGFGRFVGKERNVSCGEN